MRIIGYLTCGYPTIEKSIETAGNYVAGGCDMLEISIPLEKNKEKPFLNEIMKQAIAECADYDVYIAAIKKIAQQNPNIDITLLIYDEVVAEIGEEKFVEFCKEAKIKDVNSANLTNEYAIKLFNENGIRIAGLVNYSLDEKRIQNAITATGFVYCQAFPREGQTLNSDIDTPAKLIAYLRFRGIKNEIYCGGGIATTQDAVALKKAGADGLFLGSSIITMFDEPEKLRQIIGEYCAAVKF